MESFVYMHNNPVAAGLVASPTSLTSLVKNSSHGLLISAGNGSGKHFPSDFSCMSEGAARRSHGMLGLTKFYP
jgi:hypothetical protein